MAPVGEGDLGDVVAELGGDVGRVGVSAVADRHGQHAGATLTEGGQRDGHRGEPADRAHVDEPRAAEAQQRGLQDVALDPARDAAALEGPMAEDLELAEVVAAVGIG
jgi:hypothetical protein